MRTIIRKRKLFFAVFLLSAIALIASSYIVTATKFSDAISSKNKIINYNKKGIILTDRNNTPFFTFYSGKSYKYVPLKDIPDLTQKSFIAAEDQNFYSHHGFSIKGILRSLYLNFKGGEIVSGGSTITQQLVKNTLLNSDRRLTRKYEEIILSQLIEAKYSKNEILEMYLNSIYFGEGSYGIQAASKNYFNKDVSGLSLSESAFIAGIIPAPSRLSPFSGDLTLAKQRQKYVIERLRVSNYISDDQERNAQNQELLFKKAASNLNTTAPHFALMIRDTLIKKYGEDALYKSGYSVRTTIDLNWQKIAEDTLRDQIDNFWQRDSMNGAVVGIDQKSGEILVYVGSKEWGNDEYGKMDMAKAPRSPGSSFKPLIYAKAFEEGAINTATILKDSPTVFEGKYKPADYDRKFRGNVLVRRALANSLNVPAVQVMQEIGIESGLDIAKNMGITTLGGPSDYGLSFVLGTGEVPLTQMTQAYSVFANGGKLNPEHGILEIYDKNGERIFAQKKDPKQILDEKITFLITSILSDQQARREAFGNILDTTFPAAVKTGTSEDYRDSLTLGYTPNFTLGVWLGRNDNKPMDRVAGSIGAAPVWKKLMAIFNDPSKINNFIPPDGIVRASTCGISLGTRIASTSAVINEYFIEGSVPTENCRSKKTLTFNQTPAIGGADFQAPPPNNPNETVKDNQRQNFENRFRRR